LTDIQIEIDEDTYDILLSMKEDDESFSSVIKRMLKPSNSIDGLIDAIDGRLPSEECLEAIEASLRALREQE